MDTQPWDRQARESGPAYEAFLVYRDQPMGSRSYRDVAKQLSKSVTIIGRWGSAHGWPARVAAYDRHLEEQWQREQYVARRKAAERHVRTAKLAQSKAAQALLDLNTSQLSPAELTRLWDVAVRIERDALADLTTASTSKVEVSEDASGRVQVAVTRFREMPADMRRRALAELAEKVARREAATTGADEEPYDEGA
ncbi:hypothetical protein [Nonomuraea salmonea]|uniref:Terminase small subunit n=1 Tax=Nonomuraea salmonea TaxID=46181 RepID=A0ABV5P2T1_9ACTN